MIRTFSFFVNEKPLFNGDEVVNDNLGGGYDKHSWKIIFDQKTQRYIFYFQQ